MTRQICIQSIANIFDDKTNLYSKHCNLLIYLALNLSVFHSRQQKLVSLNHLFGKIFLLKRILHFLVILIAVCSYFFQSFRFFLLFFHIAISEEGNIKHQISPSPFSSSQLGQVNLSQVGLPTTTTAHTITPLIITHTLYLVHQNYGIYYNHRLL